MPESLSVYLLALVIGVVAGLRAMTAPAAISWGSRLGWLHPGSGLAFLAHPWASWIFTVFALGELVTDQLPSTPSRTVPVQFGTRLVSGAVCGAAVASGGAVWAGTILGLIGAVVGTLGGRAFRARLASAFGRDQPAAFIEDAIALGAALLVALSLR